MLGQKLEQLVNAIKQRRSQHEFIQLEKETTMPMGKGTYGKTKGRPPKKATPKMMPKKIIKGKKK